CSGQAGRPPDQKPYLIPNCMMRGSPADVVMRPNVPAVKFRLGLPQLKLFSRLNTSTRSSMFCVDANGTSLETARSIFQNPGPLTLLRSWLPNAPLAGCANAA